MGFDLGLSFNIPGQASAQAAVEQVTTEHYASMGTAGRAPRLERGVGTLAEAGEYVFRIACADDDGGETRTEPPGDVAVNNSTSGLAALPSSRSGRVMAAACVTRGSRSTSGGP